VKSKEVVVALFALAQESRLAVFRQLVKRGPDGYTPGELSERLSVPAPTLSFHLKELANAKLIAARRGGRFLYYSVNFDRIRAVVDFLTDQCCSLADASCANDCTEPSAKSRHA